jgi:hypothetical protein
MPNESELVKMVEIKIARLEERSVAADKAVDLARAAVISHFWR